ncbi:MAG TPA: hypothetical protein VF928_11935 [Usitatibacteraceae bacterium]
MNWLAASFGFMPDRSQWSAFPGIGAAMIRALFTLSALETMQYALNRGGKLLTRSCAVLPAPQFTLAPVIVPLGATSSPAKSHVLPVGVPRAPTGPGRVTPRMTGPFVTGFVPSAIALNVAKEQTRAAKYEAHTMVLFMLNFL